MMYHHVVHRPVVGSWAKKKCKGNVVRVRIPDQINRIFFNVIKCIKNNIRHFKMIYQRVVHRPVVGSWAKKKCKGNVVRVRIPDQINRIFFNVIKCIGNNISHFKK
uniref:Uncharacterized protein n=1 Tax=Strigamia maritima TaxID=126957 RepID=T1JKU6_STRMM